MTYSEAIFNLKEIRDYNIVNDEMYEKYLQALNMAIEALGEKKEV